MRTASATIAMVALLCLGATAVVAQEAETTAGPQPIAATTAESWVTVTGTQNLNLGKMLDMSDPRLDGDVEIGFEQHGPNGNDSTLWSTIRVTNDGGSWEGQSVGFVDHQGRHHHMGWLEGAGDYEGLSFIEQLTEPETSAGMHLDVVGLLYEGELPPMILPDWAPATD